MLRPILISVFAALAACGYGETLFSYGAAGKVWRLESLDGADVSGPAALHFPALGRVAGQTACGSFRAQQTAPYPWFEIEALAASSTDCPDQAAQTAFLDALQDMTEAEIAGGVMILSNGAGREMLFRAGG